MVPLTLGHGRYNPASFKAGSVSHSLGQLPLSGLSVAWPMNPAWSLGTRESARLLAPAPVSCPVPPEPTGVCMVQAGRDFRSGVGTLPLQRTGQQIF